MADTDVLPELKQILGALVFGSGRAVPVSEMRRVLKQVAEEKGGVAAEFGKVKESDIRRELEALNADLTQRKAGFHLAEVAGGFRLQTDAGCGPWLRHLLEIGRPNRLSRPALETLAIVAYRQPVTRSEIEAVRGVNVDHIVRSLLEMQLVRIVGRSELPGRPLLYGITQLFLEHFGLKDVKELPGIEQLCRMEAAIGKNKPQPQEPAAEKQDDDHDEEEEPAESE
ncbi:MAG: SMC-Scp complex subunit ScpB [Kiritimatiellae bacterium]|nr:SMC-Scp complex subunit ScpB [Kiritimatiellia bacterium]